LICFGRKSGCRAICPATTGRGSGTVVGSENVAGSMTAAGCWNVAGWSVGGGLTIAVDLRSAAGWMIVAYLPICCVNCLCLWTGGDDFLMAIVLLLRR
jgi:hypothetical protein